MNKFCFFAGLLFIHFNSEIFSGNNSNEEVFHQAQLNYSDSITIIAKPDKIYIEKDLNNQYLNFDFVLENKSSENLILNAIEVSVFDEKNKLARRDFVNLYSRENLDLFNFNKIKPNRRKLIYNPFPVFDKSIPLARLQYEFSFNSEKENKKYTYSIDVFPQVYHTKTNLILPIKGRLLVWDGHDYSSHHRRLDYTDSFLIKRGWTMNFQRYGYDLVVVDENGTMYKGQPKFNIDWYDDQPDDNNDYYGFGIPVYATGDGVVADARDGNPDNRKFDEAELAKNEKAYGGNYIIIDHLNGEYSWFGHLKQGSVKVKKGQKVKQGEIIGAMGASGSSLFPHLHYELRNGDGAKYVEGLPSYFSNFTRVLGSRKLVIKRGLINSGDIIESK